MWRVYSRSGFLLSNFSTFVADLCYNQEIVHRLREHSILAEKGEQLS